MNAASEEKTLQLVIKDAEQIIELLTEEKYKVDNGQLKLKLDAFSAKILKIK